MGRSEGKRRIFQKINTGQEAIFKSLISIIPDKAELFLVGGSVRDQLLGAEEKDFDFAVLGLSPEELLEIGGGDIKIKELSVSGKTIGVRVFGPSFPREGIELALTRSESSTGPGHKDWQITLGSSIEDDLKRRDFTCNAIAEKINKDGSRGELIDPFGGGSDIEKRIIRQTHPDAIKEDPLRILRAFSRVAKDGFLIEDETKTAISKRADQLSPRGPLSEERIEKELRKIISGNHASTAIRLMKETGCYSQVFPELEKTIDFQQNSRYHSLAVDEHCFEALEYAVSRNFSEPVRWAALFHDAGKPDSAWLGDDGRLHYYENPLLGKEDHEIIGARIAEDVLVRLKFPNDIQKEVTFLVENHMFSQDRGFGKRSRQKQGIIARRFLSRFGPERAKMLIELREADNSGKKNPEKSRNLSLFKKIIKEESSAPLKVTDLNIKGEDLKAIGFKGPEIGEVLKSLLERILVSPELNEKERLVSWAGKMKKSFLNKKIHLN